MYTPSAFKVTDPTTLHAFMRTHSFATLITPTPALHITHLPLLLDTTADRPTLLGHFAKPNDHWQLNHAQHPSTAVFHGPHAYVSPTYYRSPNPAVPTWNYAAVHATGHLTLIPDHAEAAALLDRLVAFYESPRPTPWQNRLPPETREKLVNSIVAFRMPIDRLEGKFKLSQNRVAEDQVGAIESLESSPHPDDRALATFARSHLRR